MEKMEYRGETYYYNKGRVYDSSFLETTTDIASAVSELYFATVEWDELNEWKYVMMIKEIKASGNYMRCVDKIHEGIARFRSSDHYCTSVFPILTSCYRNLGQPQKAIDFWMTHKYTYGKHLSVPLLTSLAAAYCDVEDFVKAKYCADKAYALQGGAQVGQTELSLVYARINKAMGVSKKR